MSEPLRVLHVNDVAGVASTAVAAARSRGLPWRLWPLPPVRGMRVPVKGARRAADLAGFVGAGRSAEVLHVHYGLFAYYAWAVRRPYLLHLHGTDVRVNLRQPSLRPLVLRAIRRADAVVYSTPDLADAVHALRPDASWLPVPLDPQVCVCGDGAESPAAPMAAPRTPPAARPPRIVFASRWDPVKGLDELVDAVRRIARDQPGAELVGVDWGVGAARAADAGVRLEPKMSPAAFRRLLAHADIVIGQQASGVLGVSDLEAMALGRPVIARFTFGDAYGDAPDIWNTADIDPATAVSEILADSAAGAERAAQARDWALRHHSVDGFVAASLALYAVAAR